MIWSWVALAMICYSLHFLFPFVAPWVYLQHGFAPLGLTFDWSPPVAKRLDVLLGLQFFSEFLENDWSVLFSFPSLKIGYVTVMIYYMHRFLFSTFFAYVFLVLISISSVYMGMSSILDCIFGALLGGFFAWVFDRFSETWIRRKSKVTVQDS